MTVKELINKLLDSPMNEEVILCYNKEHIDELGEKCSGYCFHIDDVRGSDIMFTDWREKAESEEEMNEVGVEIVKTEENEKSGKKYLNINVSNSDVQRNPDIVRLCSDVGVLEYVRLKTDN